MRLDVISEKKKDSKIYLMGAPEDIRLTIPPPLPPLLPLPKSWKDL